MRRGCCASCFSGLPSGANLEQGLALQAYSQTFLNLSKAMPLHNATPHQCMPLERCSLAPTCSFREHEPM